MIAKYSGLILQNSIPKLTRNFNVVVLTKCLSFSSRFTLSSIYVRVCADDTLAVALRWSLALGASANKIVVTDAVYRHKAPFTDGLGYCNSVYLILSPVINRR